MPQSAFTKHLDAIQHEVTAVLKPLGFSKNGRTYNRTTSGSLIHVINFQMGMHPIGDYVIPGVRESFYGKFTVNLGILLPCVRNLEHQQPPPKFVHEYVCTIRSRLSALAFKNDHWWNLSEEPSTMASLLVQLLDQFGMPFLDQFPEHSTVLDYYEAHGTLPSHNSHRSALIAAIVAYRLGQIAKGQALMVEASLSNHDGFRRYVITIAQRLGCQLEA